MWLRWSAITVVAYALGAAASVSLLGFARPVGALLGGVIFIALFGAVFGGVAALVQLIGLPRRSSAPAAWLGLTAFGFALGYVVAALVGETLGDTVSPTGNIVVGGAAIQCLSGGVLGLAIGVAQGRALRLGLAWTVATAVGAFVGQGIAAAMLELLEIGVLKANLIPAFGGIIGLFVGVAQSVVLGRR